MLRRLFKRTDDLGEVKPAPVDPLSRPHFVVTGPAAVKCFSWITQWEVNHDRAAQCRLWQFIHAAWPDTREGNWSISMTLCEVIVWRVD